MFSRARVLVALADPASQKALTNVLPSHGAEPVFASTLREARAVLSSEPIALVVCEDHLADGNYRDLLPVARAARGDVPVVVASRIDNPEEYLEAMKLGAFDFVAAPFSRTELERIVHNALNRALAAV
jgi:two-component system response regulator PilR (NtrC family)